MRKILIVVASAALAGLWVQARDVSGIDSLVDSADMSNSGFWNVLARPSVSVSDGTAAVPSLVDLSGGTRASTTASSLDTRSRSFFASAIARIRTDIRRALSLIVR